MVDKDHEEDPQVLERHVSVSKETPPFQLNIADYDYPSPLPDLPEPYFWKFNDGESPIGDPFDDEFIRAYIPRDLRLIHPDMMNETIQAAIALNYTCPESQTVRKVDKDEHKAAADKPDDCPKCQGFRFHHAGTKKHQGVPSARCKHCMDCRACAGLGKVIGKMPCSDCNSEHFHHIIT